MIALTDINLHKKPPLLPVANALILRSLRQGEMAFLSFVLQGPKAAKMLGGLNVCFF